MKKVFIGLSVLFICTLCFTGCGTKAGYKEGTYKGTATDTYGGQKNVASAEVVIDANGKITSVNLDTTYTTNDGTKTTKKALGKNYNMKTYNPSAAGEWFEQAKALEDAVIEHQDLDFLKLDADGKTDAVSGCTISISALVEALNNALDQAK